MPGTQSLEPPPKQQSQQRNKVDNSNWDYVPADIAAYVSRESYKRLQGRQQCMYRRTERIRLLQPRCNLRKILTVFLEGKMAANSDLDDLPQRLTEDDQPPLR